MKKFDYESVVGHDLVCTKLQQAVASDRTVSAYLISGPEGIGKKTVTYPFAAALLCESPQNGRACLQCSSCRLLAGGAHPDLFFLTVPPDKKSIGVEEVRDQLIKEAYVRPFSATRKVFVIEQGELMTQGAQNALLKILEEPPSYAVFIILASAQDQLLETIRSRCLKLQLLPLSAKDCAAYFGRMTEGAEKRRALSAAFSQGNLGRGQRMLCDDSYYALYVETVDKLLCMAKRPSGLSDMQRHLAEHKDAAADVIDFLLVFLRDCMRRSISPDALLICTDREKESLSFGKELTAKGLVCVMEALIHFRDRLQKNAGYTAACLELLTRIQEEIHD
ncbi:MAG: DNA polymerase III subunit delta' [Clostridia bacterium]|nr:DNA polymerase III subunit delta' [Clostridia bacterium]